MKKSFSLMVALVMLVSLALTACGNGGANTPAGNEGGGGDGDGKVYRISWAMTASSAAGDTELTKDGNLYYSLAKYVAAEIEERSDGRLVMDIYPDGVLAAGMNDLIQLVQGGDATVCWAIPSGFTEIFGEKRLSVFDVPFLFESNEEVFRLFEEYEPLNDLYHDIFENAGLGISGIYIDGWNQISTSKKVIQTPDDARGQKLRIAGGSIISRAISAIGADPTPLAWTEVFTALQQGAIDGAFMNETIIKDFSFSDVCKYMCVIDAMPSVNVIMYHDRTISALPEDLQQIFHEAMADGETYVRDFYEKARAENFDMLTSYGMEVYFPSDAELAQWRQKVIDVYGDIAPEVGGQDWLDDCIAFLEGIR